MNNKVLIISQHFYPEIGSAGNRMKNIYQMLVDKGYEVSIVTPDPAYPNKNLYKDSSFWNIEELNHDQENIQRIQTTNRKYSSSIFNRLLFFLEVAFKLSIKVFKDKNKYDLILVTSPPIFIGIVGLVAKYRFKSKMILDIRDLWPESLKGVGVFNTPIILKTFGYIEKLLYKKSDMIIVNSKGFVDYIHKKASIPKNKIVFLPNSARLNEIKDSVIEEENFRVIYTGNIGLAQDVDFLKQLAEKLSFHDIKLTIIGYGMKSNELKEYIDNEKLNNVKVSTPLSRQSCLEEIRKHQVGIVSLNNKDVFDAVLPGKIVDYMTCKTPIVGSVSGYSKKIIERNKVGYVSEKRDVEEIYNYIKYLYDNPEKRKIMSENCEKCIRESFLWEKNIDTLDTMIKKLIK